MLLVNVVCPIFSIIVVGYISGAINIVPKEGAKILNSFVFYIALPALLFNATATAPIKQLLDWNFIFVITGGIFGAFMITFICMKWLFQRDRHVAALYSMNASYGTTGYMGIPLVIAAFGPEAALPAAIATILHNIPVIIVVLLLCESAKPLQQGTKVRSILQPVFTSPLTLAVVAGMLVTLSGIPVPTALFTLTTLLADASGATALFAIGLSLAGQFTMMRQTTVPANEITIIVVLKLVVHPLLTYLLLLFFDVNPLWAAIALVMAALPVGAGVFVFAQKYDKLVPQTITAIVISIVISIGTVSVLLTYMTKVIFIQ